MSNSLRKRMSEFPALLLQYCLTPEKAIHHVFVFSSIVFHPIQTLTLLSNGPCSQYMRNTESAAEWYQNSYIISQTESSSPPHAFLRCTFIIKSSSGYLCKKNLSFLKFNIKYYTAFDTLYLCWDRKFFKLINTIERTKKFSLFPHTKITTKNIFCDSLFTLAKKKLIPRPKGTYKCLFNSFKVNYLILMDSS